MGIIGRSVLIARNPWIAVTFRETGIPVGPAGATWRLFWPL
jgi:hypothetical protein